MSTTEVRLTPAALNYRCSVNRHFSSPPRLKEAIFPNFSWLEERRAGHMCIMRLAASAFSMEQSHRAMRDLLVPTQMRARDGTVDFGASGTSQPIWACNPTSSLAEGAASLRWTKHGGRT